MSVFKLLRIVALLSVLFVLLAGTWMTERRLASWERPVWVTIYPIAATDDRATIDYVKSVDESHFEEINEFLQRELRPYGVELTPPLRFQIAPHGQEIPPAIPDRLDTASVALWSLKMRWWAWRMRRADGLIGPDIQMFVMYHGIDGEHEMQVSVGMRKGMYGLVKAYSGKRREAYNRIVIAHELMHVLGATDKYIVATGDPEYPYGFANPNQEPLFPQSQAEIMGGRIPLSAVEWAMPKSLRECRIGRRTAEEIGLFEQLVVR